MFFFFPSGDTRGKGRGPLRTQGLLEIGKKTHIVPTDETPMTTIKGMPMKNKPLKFN